MDRLSFLDWFYQTLDGPVGRRRDVERHVRHARRSRAGESPRTVAKAWVREALRDRGLSFGTPLPDAAVDPQPGIDAEATRLLMITLRHQAEICLGVMGIFGRLDLGADQLRAELLLLFALSVGDTTTAERLHRDISRSRFDAAKRLARGLGDHLRDRWNQVKALPGAMRTGFVLDETERLAALAIDYQEKQRVSSATAARVGGLDDATLIALIEALAGVAWVDGEMAPEEQELIEERIAATDLDSAGRRRAMRAIYSPREVGDIARDVEDPDARRFILEQVILQSHADGVVVESEKGYIEELARRFGIDGDELNAALASVADFCERNKATMETAPGGDAVRSLHGGVYERVATLVGEHAADILDEAQDDRRLAAAIQRLADGQADGPSELYDLADQLLAACRRVPALAAFAAGGGGLLLSVLADQLPEIASASRR